jgi:hypothetical protein
VRSKLVGVTFIGVCGTPSTVTVRPGMKFCPVTVTSGDVGDGKVGLRDVITGAKKKKSYVEESLSPFAFVTVTFRCPAAGARRRRRSC